MRFAALALGAALLSVPVLSASSAPVKKSPAKPAAKAKASKPKASKVQNVVVAIDGSGYTPDIVSVKAGVPVRMVFVSKGTGCANSVVIPALNKKFHLRPGQKQAVAFTPKKGQSINFLCSMDMFHGKAVVR
jgi:plastocyanin domain-containing protein